MQTADLYNMKNVPLDELAKDTSAEGAVLVWGPR